MASTYNGILVRANGNDTGTMPRTGDFTGCPDIIPFQQTSVSDPQATFGSATGSPTSYDQNPGLNIIANDVNYIYVRGKNTGTSTITGNTYLFYCPSNLVLWPQQWMTPDYMILPDPNSPNGNQQYIQMTAQPGAICVVPQPFVWPHPQMPADGTHYCLVTLTGTNDQIVQMQQSAMQTISADGLGYWIANNGGAGWRNVVTVNANSPDFTTYTTYQSGATNSIIYFQLICTNVPAGAQIAFSAAAPNNGGTGYSPIQLPWTTVSGAAGTTQASFMAGIQTNVVQNYQSSIYYQYKSNGYPTPAGMNITLQAIVISNNADALKDHTTRLADFVPVDSLVYHPELGEYFTALTAWDSDGPFGPSHNGNLSAAVLGSHTTKIV